jgi:hypothetical protein
VIDVLFSHLHRKPQPPAKHALLEQFMYINDQFAKTGSGQTEEKLRKKGCYSHRLRILLQRLYQLSPVFGAPKTPFLCVVSPGCSFVCVCFLSLSWQTIDDSQQNVARMIVYIV